MYRSNIINYDSDEEKRSISGNSYSDNSSEEDEKMQDADDSHETSFVGNNNYNQPNNSTDDLTNELVALSLYPNEKRDDNQNDDQQNEPDDYILNNVLNKHTTPSINSIIKQEAYKLFICGEKPSKIDRAVFLAIQNFTPDASKYPYLSLWFENMSKFNQSDMQAWKTPNKYLQPNRLCYF